MNVLVTQRVNGAGMLSATPAVRLEAAQQVTSMARANLLGRLRKAGTLLKSASGNRVVTQELDRDAFLRLLVLQMQNQNPLEPIENNEMLAQLAQFSALEQMNNLNESFELLSGNIDQLNFISASALVGRQVIGVDMTGQPIEGTVQRVHLDGSLVYLTIDDRLMSMAGVIAIE